MPYNILAINPGHNGSAAFVSDGKLLYYCEEERLSRLKYDGNPFRSMLQILNNFKVDELVIGGTTEQLHTLPWTNENSYSALARKFNPAVKTTIMGGLHHLGHAANAFYNSGFETAAAVIVDGAGSFHEEIIGNTSQKTGGYEAETIYHCSYPHDFIAVYKRYSNGDLTPYYDNGIQEFDSSVTITKAYEAVSYYLGFGFIEAGKTMGLAPYGSEDNNIPPFFVNGKGNKNALIPYYPAGAFVDENRNLYLKKFDDSSIWHSNANLIREVDKNIAFHIQKETEEQVYNLIQKAIDITGETNVVISGGYGLNCVANYKYLKKFPGINFYIDPISHDGGTAIGLARYAWHQYSKSTQIDKLRSVYLSALPDYNLLKVVETEIPGLQVSDITPAEVATLIKDGNIVAIFQGASEGGPRALGNRSILFDPRSSTGKDYVNIVKKREWFRPFAGSVLVEHAREWFDMATLDESPYMMYAVDVRPEKASLIPAVTHVDNTCRVQTVSKSDNPGYYQLISEFYAQTGVPILFNTSFNLAGQPLVETIIDAAITIINSEINYLYLPEINKMVCKKQ